jgi:GxxExxY protein
MNDAMLHSEITDSILGAAFEVSNELGSGFLESIYRKSLAILLAEKGHTVEEEKQLEEKQLEVLFRGQPVGTYYADLVVDEKVLIELKATAGLLPQHKAQTIHYLKATGIKVALLINFGKPRLDYVRIYPSGKTP